MGKVTLKLEPEVYRLSASQTKKYKKYPHLAYELRNIFGIKHLLHLMFTHLNIFLSIYLLKFRIKF